MCVYVVVHDDEFPEEFVRVAMCVRMIPHDLVPSGILYEAKKAVFYKSDPDVGALAEKLLSQLI